MNLMTSPAGRPGWPGGGSASGRAQSTFGTPRSVSSLPMKPRAKLNSTCIGIFFILAGLARPSRLHRKTSGYFAASTLELVDACKICKLTLGPVRQFAGRLHPTQSHFSWLHVRKNGSGPLLC